MRTFVVAVAGVVVAVAVLAGCGGSERQSDWPVLGARPAVSAPPSAAPSAQGMVPATSSAARSTTVPPTTDVAGCYNGNCTLAVSGTATVPLDAAAFYYPALTITVESSDTIRFEAGRDGGGTTMMLGAGGTANFGDLHLTWTSTGPTSAVVVFSHE